MNRRLGFVVVTALCFALPTFATELASNGTFQGSLVGWTPLNPFGGLYEYSSSDHTQSSGSGSARVTNAQSVASGGFELKQCISGITAGQEHDLEGYIYAVNNSEQPSGYARVLVSWFGDSGCTGASISTTGVTNQVWTTQAGAWHYVQHQGFTAPSGAVAASLRLFVLKQGAGGYITFHFDDISFRRRGGPIFTDGFESGTTGAWSNTVS